MNYIKPVIKIKKVKINMFLSNRYFDSVSFPISQVFASFTPPGTGDGGLVCYSESDYSGGGAWACY